MNRIILTLTLLLGVCLGISANNLPKRNQLVGVWYLEMMFQNSFEAAKPLLETTEYTDGATYSIKTSYDTPSLQLEKNGKGIFKYKVTSVLKYMKNDALVIHHLKTKTVTTDLRWKLKKNCLVLSLVKGKGTEPGSKYKINVTRDYSNLKGNIQDLAYYDNDVANIYKGEEDNRESDESMEFLFENISKMQIEDFHEANEEYEDWVEGGERYYDSHCLTLNGRLSYRFKYTEVSSGNPPWETNHIYFSSSASPQREESKLSEEHIKMAEKASKQLANYYMKTIAPQSGREPSCKLNTDLASYDEWEHEVKIPVTLEWLARDVMSGVSYGRCQVKGVVTIYPSIRYSDPYRASFKMTSKNEQATKVSTPSQWKNLENIKPFEIK